MRKFMKSAVLILAAVTMFAGCSKKSDSNKSMADVVVEKDGKISVKYEEIFDKDYYTEEDLEKVISAKIGKKVSVILHDYDGCGCVPNNSPFAAIESIVVYEDLNNDKGFRRVDFHVGYNADFVELTEKYAPSLKVCCV